MKHARRPPGGPSDSSLVGGCLDGDAAAWEALVRRYRRLVYSVPLKMGLKAEDADEVFQETFQVLLRKLTSVRDRERIGLWLGVTARRKALDLLTRGPRVHELTGMPGAPGAGASEPMPDEALIRLERQERVRQAVERLPERCRRLLAGLYFEDPPLSYRQLAARLKVPAGSLGPTRMRCLEALRRLLKSS